MNDQGAIKLVEGIVDCAVKDYMATTPGSIARAEVERFFLSGWFETLTGGNGIALLKTLDEAYEKKRKKRRKGQHHEKNQD